MKFLLASLKKLAGSQNCSESRIKFLLRLSFALIGQFFPVYIHSRRNNIQDHRQVTEQLLETQAAITIRKPE
jgi:hypothetical protein